VIKKWYEAVQPHLSQFGWSVGSALVGAGIGLMVAILWDRTVGW
jgi:hypothetical protein